MKAILILAALLAPAAAGAQALPGKAPMDARELAEARGGFRLPGGMEVRLGVTTETRVNGALVFRTNYNLDQGAARFRVLGRTGDDAGGPSDLMLTNANNVVTRDGTVSLLPNGARLVGDGLEISHLVGEAFGTVLANSGNDRAIDLTTTLDIQLSGVTPDMLGSSAFRVEGLALEATTRLTR